MTTTTRIFAFGACAALSLGLAACNPASDQGSGTPPPASKPAPMPAGPQVQGIMGEPTAVGDLEFTVNSLTTAPEFEDSKAGDGKHFAIIEVDVTNNGSEAVTLTSSALKVQGDDGNAYIPANPETFDAPFKAGFSRVFPVAYEVPDGVTAFQVTFSPIVKGKALGAVLVSVQ